MKFVGFFFFFKLFDWNEIELLILPFWLIMCHDANLNSNHERPNFYKKFQKDTFEEMCFHYASQVCCADTQIILSERVGFSLKTFQVI